MSSNRTQHPITLGTKLFYGFGSVAYGVKDQGFAYLLLIYYNQVLGLPAKQVGFALLIVLLIDACLDPIIGQWSDMLHSRWGRRHPFMYATALPVALSYLLLWDPPAGLSGPTLFWYLLGIAVLIRFLIALYEIPSSALAPELTTSYHERTSLLGYRQLFGWLGGLTMAFLAFGVFLTPDAEHKVGQLNPIGYAHYGWTAAALMFGAIVISAAGTHRRIPYLKAPPPRRRFAPLREIREMAAMLAHRSLLMLLFGGLFSGTAIGLTTALTYYFFTYFWELTSKQIAVLLFANVISALVALPLATLASRRLGKKQAAILLWSSALIIGPLLLILRLAGLLPANGTDMLRGILFVHSAIWIALFIGSAILIASMIADVVEERQVATGRRAEGLLFAANSFILKFTSGIGIYGAGILLGVVGFPEGAVPGKVDTAVLNELAIVFAALTTVLFLVAIGFISAYRIDRKTHEANVQRLAEAGALAAPAAKISVPGFVTELPLPGE